MCNCNLCKWHRREITKAEYLEWLKSEKEKALAKKGTPDYDGYAVEECDEMLWDVEHEKRIYISGPISSDKEHYQEHFKKAVEYLHSKGYDVINPATEDYTEAVKESGIEDIWSFEAWLWYIKRDMDIVANCDGIYMLDGWMQSDGAKIELAVAKRKGLPIYYESEEEMGTPLPDYTESELWELYHPAA